LLFTVDGSINVTSPVDATAIAKMIAGPGIVVTRAQLFCAKPEQAGLFANFDPNEPATDDDALDTDDALAPPPLSGALLGSAFAEDCGGPDDEITDDTVIRGRDELNGTGSAALNALLPTSRVTRDACVLRIEFTCPVAHDRIGIQYVFGSNNYPSTGATPNEDVMGAFVNGRSPRNNVARAPGVPLNPYLSVNTLFGGANFVDNQQRLLEIGMNGFTKTISSVGDIAPSATNFVEIVIADGGSRARRTRDRNLRQRGDNEVEDNEDTEESSTSSRQLQGNQASGAWLFLTTNCLTCIRATDLTRPRGQTAVRTCATMAASGARCRCAWSCMSSAIKRMCVFTGATTKYSTYVSQVRTNINARFCRRIRE
jgi:hypothetical protein